MMIKVKKYVLIYNPISGHAVFRKRLDYMINEFQKRNAMLIPYRTKIDNKELPLFLQEASPDGVLAAGGDGTLHEVVNVLLQNKIDLPIAVIPSGTSNDFATFLEVKKDFSAYLDRIVDGKSFRLIDAGRAGSTYFINVACAGMFTSIAHEVAPKFKNTMGKTAYYIYGFAQMPRAKSVDITIKADGVTYREKAFLFVVVNSDIVGSMRHVAEEARVDDGRLDLLLVRQCSFPELVSLTTELFEGRPVTRRKEILYIQAKEFEISAEEELESDFDGERGPMLPLKIETVPKAIKMFC